MTAGATASPAPTSPPAAGPARSPSAPLGIGSSSLERLDPGRRPLRLSGAAPPHDTRTGTDEIGCRLTAHRNRRARRASLARSAVGERLEEGHDVVLLRVREA